jgi:predicted nucleic acid-binding protein
MRAKPRDRILLDTGPLVAMLSPNDSCHQDCVNALREIAAPLFSCWPVLTEAAWLMRRSPSGVQRLLDTIESGLVDLLPLAASDGRPIAAIMKKYESIRPQLADAALVHLAHREEIQTIFTLDRRDFSIYRDSRRRAFHIIPQL